MNGMRSSLGELLRRTTAAGHAEIDRHPLLRPLVSPSLKRHEYARALAVLHALHAALEPALGSAVSVGPASFPFAARLDALEQDLAALGETPFPDGGHLAGCSPNSPSEAVGVLYVLEGSRLGGRMIHGRLRSNLPDQPMSYFAATAASPETSWRDFQNFLTQAEPCIHTDAATSSAIRIFLGLRLHLDTSLWAVADAHVQGRV